MKKERSSIVDVIRLFAIIMVIAFHLILPPIVETGRIDLGRLTITCLVGDTVVVFWIVTGFFMFREKKYSEKIKHLIKDIVVPMLIIIFISQILSNFIKSEMNIIDCFANYKFNLDNFKNIILAILNLNVINIPYGQHLWFMMQYIINFLWLPLLSLCLKKDNNAKLAKKIIMTLSILSLSFEAVQRFLVLPIGKIVPPTIISISLLTILIGYDIYENINKIKNNKKIRYIGLAVYIGVSILKIILQYLDYKQNIANAYFLYWSNIISVIDSIGIVLFFLSFDLKPNKLINYLGKNVFKIYLVHWIVIEKLKSSGVINYIYKMANVESSRFINEILYMIIITIIVTFISLAIVLIGNVIVYLVKKLMKGKENTNEIK